ncbi:hypothetical protein ANCCEY_07268 [Ancylostoma ceylanicum]|uniref:Reverse transcriptase domain-containing protein n=2 Tax=Ancylostoma ceylanicum TaxID=53326 RepID=A0A0D6LNJ1_9BILA|nr:hypothetical protein ANCCEY_07268 [Ancylostoma ceylanicum]EYC39504.1 hypothetical protein Y032_0653g1172 [Ancylostoma ceylanicum]
MPAVLRSIVYELFMRVTLNRIERTLDEGQPCEQAGFQEGFSTIDHMHTVTRLIEVPREYKMPNCLTSINLKEVFDPFETEAVLEPPCNWDALGQCIRIFRESTTTSQPKFRHSMVTSSSTSEEGFDRATLPKPFTSTLENIVRTLDRESMVVRIDGRLPHHLSFADNIVLTTPTISQTEHMLAESDDA